MPSIERISAWIGAIYECVLVPGQWGSTLRAMCSELNFANGVLAINELPSDEPSIFVSVGLEPDWLARMPGYGLEVVRLWGGVARIQQYPLEEPILQSEATNRALWHDNRWATEWAVPQGLIDAVSIVLTREPTMVGNLTFGRHRLAGEVGETEMSILRLIAPHVRRAVTIGQLLDAQTVASSTFASALEALSSGVVLVDEHLGIVHANTVARAMLAATDPIGSQSGSLKLPTTATTDALRTAVAAAARDEIELGRRGIGIPLRRSNGIASVAHVLPLRRPTIREGLTQRATAAVFIAPAASPPQLPADALALLYGLTPAEVRIFELIADGRTAADIADTLGIAPSTVKTHLLRVFEKTGCNRQAALVKLAASMTLPW